MSAHKQSCNDSKVGIKAYQNIVGSLNAFERLIALLPSKDHILLSSIFCFAVVKYAKPFIATKTPFGRTKYSTESLVNTSGFNVDIHNHLLELRHTLIAHDDLESIEPRILQFCIRPTDSKFTIPISIALSNKCLAYPIDVASINKLRAHVASCAQGVIDKIYIDLAKIRDAALKDQEELNQDLRYTKDYGQHRSEEDGSNIQPPDFMSDEWLNSSAPGFELIHNGLQYEELKIRRDFYGPEAVALPNGDTIQISPN